MEVDSTVVELQHISKSFGGIQALDDVAFDVRAGEVHALVGENGAGKSTLVRIMTGVHVPDSGEIKMHGEPVTVHSPADAHALGIAAIYQEPTLFPDLDVAENIFMDRQPSRPRTRQIAWGVMYQQAQELINRLGVRLDVHARVRGLSVADQQIVEIAKALSTEARVLIMDEPTAALSLREVEELFRIIRQLRAEGVAIVFISHRLDEVYAIADRITVLRDGKYVGSGPPAELPQDQLIQMMVGRALDKLFPKQNTTIGEPVLRVEHLTRQGVFYDISFELRRGEILGLAGLVGAHRTEVARAIFGIDPLDGGRLVLDGKSISIHSPQDALRHGIAYLPEDRQHQGLILPMPISHNITLPILQQMTFAGWVQVKREQQMAEEQGHRLQIRGATSFKQAVRQLSGGNQQKVVLAKWLATQPRILILDEPTRGIDVGTKAEVHRLISQLAAQGLAILMISSELPEILGMSDRIIVMHEGRLTGEFTRDEATQEKIMACAMGKLVSRDTGTRSTAPALTLEAPDPLSSTASPIVSAHKEGVQGRPRAVATRDKTRPSLLVLGSVMDHTPRGNLASTVARFREAGILIFLAALILVFSIHTPRFFTPSNLQSILLDISLLTIVAVGEAMVIISRNIDLSVGSIVGFGAFVAAVMVKDYPHLPVSLILLVGIAFGMVLGLVNGLLVTVGRIPAIIATLGTLFVYRGIDFVFGQTTTPGGQVYSVDLTSSFIGLATGTILHIPDLIFFAAIVAVIFAYVLRYTHFGRRIYAVGSNPTAAVLAGIDVGRTTLLVFVLSGALAGLASVLYASRYATVTTTDAEGFELQVIAAVVIGGANIFGGSGSILGTVLGALLLGVIGNYLAVSNLSEFWQKVVQGAIILAAVVVDAVVNRRLQKALQVRSGEVESPPDKTNGPLTSEVDRAATPLTGRGATP